MSEIFNKISEHAQMSKMPSIFEHTQKSVSNQRFVTDTKNVKHFLVSMIFDEPLVFDILCKIR